MKKRLVGTLLFYHIKKQFQNLPKKANFKIVRKEKEHKVFLDDDNPVISRDNRKCKRRG